MFRLLSILVLVINFGCSSQEPKPRPTLVPAYIQQWKTDYAPKEKFAKAYEQYLSGVETIYVSRGIESKFPHYLSSLNNLNQLLAHTEFNLSYRYKKEKGRWANTRSQDYIRFKTKIMRETHSRLYQERQLKLRTEIGEETYQVLIEHYSRAKKIINSTDFPI